MSPHHHNNLNIMLTNMFLTLVLSFFNLNGMDPLECSAPPCWWSQDQPSLIRVLEVLGFFFHFSKH